MDRDGGGLTVAEWLRWLGWSGRGLVRGREHKRGLGIGRAQAQESVWEGHFPLQRYGQRAQSLAPPSTGLRRERGRGHLIGGGAHVFAQVLDGLAKYGWRENFGQGWGVEARMERKKRLPESGETRREWGNESQPELRVDCRGAVQNTRKGCGFSCLAEKRKSYRQGEGLL